MSVLFIKVCEFARSKILFKKNTCSLQLSPCATSSSCCGISFMRKFIFLTGKQYKLADKLVNVKAKKTYIIFGLLNSSLQEWQADTWEKRQRTLSSSPNSSTSDHENLALTSARKHGRFSQALSLSLLPGDTNHQVGVGKSQERKSWSSLQQHNSVNLCWKNNSSVA